MPDLARADLTECKVGGKPGGRVAAGVVSLVAVFAHSPVDEQPQPGVSRDLTRCPRCPDAARPVRLHWFETPNFKVIREGPGGRRGEGRRSSKGPAGGLTLSQRSIERGINTEWPARCVGDLLGFEQDLASETPQLHGTSQRPFQ